MRAAVLVADEAGGTMAVRDLPTPEPGDGEVLVRVRATALNRGELLQRRRGRMAAAPAGPPRPGGVEFAGEVERLGPSVAGVTPGDRVMGRAPASYAEFVVVDQRELMPVPAQMSWEEAAAIPNVFITAHDAIVTNGRLQPGESVLVNAASSGVGTAALQIAKLLGARPVIGSSGSAAKLERLRSLGMDVGISTSEGPITERVLEATGGAGVNLIIDNVGGSVLDENLRCMALEGRLISVGRTGAEKGELDMDLLALRRLRLIGVTFRTRTREEAIACSRRFAADLLPAFRDGRLRPVIDRVFPLEEIAAAQAYMESNAHLGKIVLRL
jgi:NADPH:quinone reductase-like Zn-dependent oxidoreductase